MYFSQICEVRADAHESGQKIMFQIIEFPASTLLVIMKLRWVDI